MMRPSDDLDAFVRAAQAACAERLHAALDPELAGALLAALDAHRARHVGAAAHPAAMVRLVACAEGQGECDRVFETAVGFTLYYLALRVLDDAQDGELRGPLLAEGPAVASTGALALYTLALDALQAAGEELPLDRRRMLRDILCASGMQQAAGQRRDLLRAAPQGLGGMVAQVAAKSAVFALVLEYTACLCGGDAARVAGYATIGRHLCLMRQAINDIRDIFGDGGTDLATGRPSLPVAALRAGADEAALARFSALQRALPGSLAELRLLLVRSGAVAAVAAEMERARREIWLEARALAVAGGPFARMLAFADAMSAQVYRRPQPAVRSDMSHATAP